MIYHTITTRVVIPGDVVPGAVASDGPCTYGVCTNGLIHNVPLAVVPSCLPLVACQGQIVKLEKI